jgi:oxaloacetate decarboxylase alpha subunit
MAEVKFIDTTIRDGAASLWAMNMRTGHMLSVISHLDRAGFDQMEFFAPGSRLKKFVRHLHENPWHWLKMGSALAERTQLRLHGGVRGTRMSGHFSPAVADLLIEKVVDLGIRYTRAGSNWNDAAVTREDKERLESLGMTPVIDMIYSVSPKHTDDYYVEKARDVAALNPYRICLKDVGGLLTPERTRELLRLMLAETGDIEWEFHGHSNNGLAPLNALEAVKAGVSYVHTAVPPLASGDSQPSVYNVASNLRALGYDIDIDDDALQPVTSYLTEVARIEGFPIGVPREYDERLYSHQIPGGMISNFVFQLKQVGMESRLPAVLDETARVRAEFGYPIMVTPLSQIVGTQAAINVIAGERYRQVTDETIHYALGRHGGREAVEGMDPDVRDRILDRPRARQLEHWEPPNPTLAELRERFGMDVSDEDLILRAIVGDDAADVVRNVPTPRPILTTEQPLTSLVQELARLDNHRFISVRRGDVAVTVKKRVTSETAAVPRTEQ